MNSLTTKTTTQQQQNGKTELLIRQSENLVFMDIYHLQLSMNVSISIQGGLFSLYMTNNEAGCSCPASVLIGWCQNEFT